MLLCKAISLRSLIAKEMSQDFSQNTHTACTHPYAHTQRQQAKKKGMVTGSLEAIMYPVNPIFSATLFIPIGMADFFQRGEQLFLGYIYTNGTESGKTNLNDWDWGLGS